MADQNAPAPADTANAATTPPDMGTSAQPDTGNPAATVATPNTSTLPPTAGNVDPPKADTANADPALQDQLRSLQSELDKWKAQAKKHETRSTANATAATELERLKREAMSEQERAVNDAKAAGRVELLAQFAGQLVGAEFRAAAAGRIEPERLAIVLEGLNLSRFIDESTATVKAEDIARFVDGIAPLKAPEPPAAKGAPTDQPSAVTAPPGQSTPPDLGQGSGRSTPPGLNDNTLETALRAAVGAPKR